jgi:tetratricopeptide (TPR) repeat protein
MRALRAILCLAMLLALAWGQPAADPERLFREAVSAQQRGDNALAVQQYRRVVETRPDFFSAWVNLGVALVQLKQFPDAIESYKRALALDPKNRDVQLYLALAYLKNRDEFGASAELEKLAKADPKDLRVAILLGDCYLQLGEYDRALTLLAPLAKMAGDNPDFLWVFGSVLISNGRLREGVALVERVAQQTQAADAYLLAGRTLFRLNEFERARDSLETAVRLNPNLPGVYTALGLAREKMVDNQGAMEAFRKGLEREPNDFEANFGLGSILYYERDLEAARTHLDRALRIDPSAILARYEMALVEKAAGQIEAATADLETIVKADPNFLNAHVELATLYFRLKRVEDGARERQIVDRLSEAERRAGPGK